MILVNRPLSASLMTRPQMAPHAYHERNMNKSREGWAENGLSTGGYTIC